MSETIEHAREGIEEADHAHALHGDSTARRIAVLIAVLAAVGTWWLRHRSGAATAGGNAIAVLPLQNMNGDFNIDYYGGISCIFTATSLRIWRPGHVQK